MSRDFDVLVYSGRFQPLHNGHCAILERALTMAERVVVVVGSSNRPRSTRDPFTFEERAALIRKVFAAEAERFIILPMRDFFDDRRWARAVREAVNALLDSPSASVGMIGPRKEDESIRDDFAPWPFVAAESLAPADAGFIRDAWLEGAALPAAELPQATARFLQAQQGAAHYPALQDEHRFLQAYKKSWQAAPYPPIFVTVDTVVRCRDHVLLIRRGGFPGRGLWALPGGFLDQHERVAAAALRELQEETGLNVSETLAQSLLKGSQLFDHPQRSQRGRTVTHAFYFDLGDSDIPAVAAADDAAEAVWWPIERLRNMEEHMLDDHFVILEHFLWPEHRA